LGDGLVVAIATIVERFSHSASLLVFFALFILMFGVAWKMAVWVTERYLVRQP
jgi:hypothetical protein